MSPPYGSPERQPRQELASALCRDREQLGAAMTGEGDHRGDYRRCAARRQRLEGWSVGANLSEQLR